jgi:hypothetical protein
MAPILDACELSAADACDVNGSEAPVGVYEAVGGLDGVVVKAGDLPGVRLALQVALQFVGPLDGNGGRWP